MTAEELKAIVMACNENVYDHQERYGFYTQLVAVAGVKVSEDAMGIDDEFDDAVDDAEPA